MTCPHCGKTLEGLGRYCHNCNQYTTYDAREAAGTSEGPEDSRRPKSPSTALEPAASPCTVVLPLISQNRMWRTVARPIKEKLYAAVRADDWHGVMRSISAQIHVSHDGRKYKQQAAEWLAAQRTVKYECEVRLRVTLYLPKRVGDTDNFLKPMLDVLQGVLFEDDKQVSEIHVVRRYDKERPRAVVTCEQDDGGTALDPGAEFQYEVRF